MISSFRKTLRRGRCPHRPAPKTVISIPNRQPPTVGANIVRPQRARCEPSPPIQRREKGSLTAAAASPSPSGNGDGRLAQGWRAACSPLRGIPVFRYTMISSFRKTLRRGRCPHRPAPKTVISIPNRQPPTVGANIVRPQRARCEPSPQSNGEKRAVLRRTSQPVALPPKIISIK